MELCSKLADHFSGGSLLFDVPSVLLKKILNRKYKRLGVQGVDHVFGLGSPKKILKWSNKIKTMSCTIFFKGIDLDPRWIKRTRIMMRPFRTFRFYKLVKLTFEE